MIKHIIMLVLNALCCGTNVLVFMHYGVAQIVLVLGIIEWHKLSWFYVLWSGTNDVGFILNVAQTYVGFPCITDRHKILLELHVF